MISAALFKCLAVKLNVLSLARGKKKRMALHDMTDLSSGPKVQSPTENDEVSELDQVHEQEKTK